MPIAKYFNTFELKDPMMITSAILSQFLVVVYAGLMFVLYLESQADVRVRSFFLFLIFVFVFCFFFFSLLEGKSGRCFGVLVFSTFWISLFGFFLFFWGGGFHGVDGGVSLSPCCSWRLSFWWRGKAFVSLCC